MEPVPQIYTRQKAQKIKYLCNSSDLAASSSKNQRRALWCQEQSQRLILLISMCCPLTMSLLSPSAEYVTADIPMAETSAMTRSRTGQEASHCNFANAVTLLLCSRRALTSPAPDRSSNLHHDHQVLYSCPCSRPRTWGHVHPFQSLRC